MRQVQLDLDLDAIRDILAGEPLVLDLAGIELTLSVKPDEQLMDVIELLDLPRPRYPH